MMQINLQDRNRLIDLVNRLPVTNGEKWRGHKLGGWD